MTLTPIVRQEGVEGTWELRVAVVKQQPHLPIATV
jgi:hypothetical protein